MGRWWGGGGGPGGLGAPGGFALWGRVGGRSEGVGFAPRARDVEWDRDVILRFSHGRLIGCGRRAAVGGEGWLRRGRGLAGRARSG